MMATPSSDACSELTCVQAWLELPSVSPHASSASSINFYCLKVAAYARQTSTDRLRITIRIAETRRRERYNQR